MITITGTSLPVKALIRSVYQSALKYLELKDEFEISVTIIDEKSIRELNATHRGIDSVTDVLSFPNVVLDFPVRINDYPLDINPSSGLLPLGDIVICKKVAEMQAKNLGHSIEREYAFLALHGMLHLFGFDHIKEDDEQKMLTAQRTVLETLGIGR